MLEKHKECRPAQKLGVVAADWVFVTYRCPRQVVDLQNDAFLKCLQLKATESHAITSDLKSCYKLNLKLRLPCQVWPHLTYWKGKTNQRLWCFFTYSARVYSTWRVAGTGLCEHHLWETYMKEWLLKTDFSCFQPWQAPIQAMFQSCCSTSCFPPVEKDWPFRQERNCKADF